PGGEPPMGRPLAGRRALVLDGNGEPVPLGVVGEIHLGGDGLARGYHGRPDLTAERFVPDPWGEGSRLFRTGDLARHLADGRLEYLGRRDAQVKVRGFRIEPGEVEAALALYPGVDEAVVTARPGPAGDLRLVAYVASAAGAAGGAGELRAYLEELLPAYMVPSSFVTLAALPRTPNGKLDRRALPSPESLQARPERQHVEPRGDLERTLCEVWQEVLGVPEVGIHDHFFADLGGSSLLMVRVAAKLHEILDPRISVVELFRFPTVGALALHLSGEPREAAREEAGPRSRLRQESMARRRQLKQQLREAEAQ
ncbi:MAG TPA: non-ribosomal peptide synthetase, partial [Thermoanaerobaculia bacterium]|nr:non-ribosomal peptide synthetase [Thermoanaerobaculia bacterium]